MGHKDHKDKADDTAPAKCAVLTVSDTRTPETDSSGKLAFEILTKFANAVIETRIVKNDRKAILKAVGKSIKAGADLVVTIGGTGISKKDLTVESVRELFEKELPGFGELFRTLSAKEIGTGAILSRATLGVTAEGRLILVLPGSEGAVRLALEGILMSELKHLLWELKRYS